MQPVGFSGQLDPALGLLDARDVVVLEPEITGKLPDLLLVASIEVDPQELPVADALLIARLQLDRPVAAIRVEQPAADAAQRSMASRTAPTTAIRAVAYWSTSIARSCRPWARPTSPVGGTDTGVAGSVVIRS
jgi:hypothetical protein